VKPYSEIVANQDEGSSLCCIDRSTAESFFVCRITSGGIHKSGEGRYEDFVRWK
jgi:hypothetical protein